MPTKLYVIRIGSMNNGIHSVYINKSRAIKAYLYYRIVHPDNNYILKEEKPEKISYTHNNKLTARFKDSFWLDVNEENIVLPNSIVYLAE